MLQLSKNSKKKTKRKDRRRGKLVTGISPITGKKYSFRKAKYLPDGCKTAKRICIVCLKNSIRKTASNYDLKTCKECLRKLPADYKPPASKAKTPEKHLSPFHQQPKKKIEPIPFEPKIILRKKQDQSDQGK